MTRLPDDPSSGGISSVISPEELARAFDWVEHREVLEGLAPDPDVPPRSLLPVIRATPQGDEWALLRWGLVPSRASDPAVGNRLINARAETVHEKPAFQEAFAFRRCLIPVTGFYQWKRKSGKKQPFFIRLQDEMFMTLAGLWERWQSVEGETLETCAFLTIDSNRLVSTLSQRMPVIIEREHHDLWLHGESLETVRKLLRPVESNRLDVYPVNPAVMDSRESGSENRSSRQMRLDL